MNGYVDAWQCIGCGRIEAPETCMGVCEDRKVRFVYADEHDRTLAALALALRRAEASEALVQRLACTHPHGDRFESAFRALQTQARTLLASLRGHAPEAVQTRTRPR